MLTVNDLPEAHASIDMGNGYITCPMFLYLPEGADPQSVMRECGYQWRIVTMENDNPDLFTRLFDGDENTLVEWEPACPAEGYTLAAKHENEDGEPVSIWVQRLPSIGETLTPADFEAQPSCPDKAVGDE